jgi:hypothetical protein
VKESNANHYAFKIPNDPAQFAPCSFLRASPWDGQE